MPRRLSHSSSTHSSSSSGSTSPVSTETRSTLPIVDGDRDMIIAAVATAIEKLIAPDANTPGAKPDDTSAAEQVSVDDIKEYMHHIITECEMISGVEIVALIYLERLKKTSGMPITNKNWRPLVTTALLLASKVWDDLSVFNQDMTEITPYTLEDINKWESNFFFDGINNDINITPKVFDAKLKELFREIKRQQTPPLSPRSR